MLFERSTHDVICIESTKLYSFPFHTFRAKKIYIYLRYRFAKGTRFRTKNIICIPVERRRFHPKFLERSTVVICIKNCQNRQIRAHPRCKNL